LNVLTVSQSIASLISIINANVSWKGKCVFLVWALLSLLLAEWQKNGWLRKKLLEGRVKKKVPALKYSIDDLKTFAMQGPKMPAGNVPSSLKEYWLRRASSHPK
jgi:hypothetical protein